LTAALARADSCAAQPKTGWIFANRLLFWPILFEGLIFLHYNALGGSHEKNRIMYNRDRVYRVIDRLRFHA
jgi:hypothetical protein